MNEEHKPDRCKIHPWVPEPWPCTECYLEWDEEHGDEYYPAEWMYVDEGNGDEWREEA